MIKTCETLGIVIDPSPDVGNNRDLIDLDRFWCYLMLFLAGAV